MTQLTKGQLEEIQQYILTLPEHERESKLKEIMSQFEQSTPQCPFCLMTENKIQTTKVYDDQYLIAVLEINPANPGHILLFPKRHISTFASLNEQELEILPQILKKLQSALITLFKSSNIIISEGPNSGQKFEHLVINLIPRQKNDSITIAWGQNKISEDELKKLQKNILESIPQEKKEPKIEPPKNLKERLKKTYLP